MSTTLKTDSADLTDSLRRTVARALRRLLDVAPSSKCLRYEFECPNIDPVIWLHNQKVDSKTYWADRHNNFEMAGIFETDVIEGVENPDYEKLFEQCHVKLSSEYPNIRYYGGISFSQLKESPEWTRYGRYRFVIPQFEVVRSEEKCVFAVNVPGELISSEIIDEYLAKLENISFESTTRFKKVPKVLDRCDSPNKESWGALVNRVLNDEINKTYEKIVLARKSIFEFDVPINPVALVKHLRDMTPGCFHFCFQKGDNEGFLGATPERLFKADKNTIQTEAVAGTTTRGKTSEEDAKLASKLRHSDKERLEHTFVIDDIKKSLETFCKSVSVEEKFNLMKLKGGQHLTTRITGELKDYVQQSDILRTLHPTPAVAGHPTDVTIRAIQEIEPFDRGWYAGPVGYIGLKTSEFAVGIRSGLVSQHKLSLYAGAGIVNGSEAQTEWNEIESKISRFIKVFDV